MRIADVHTHLIGKLCKLTEMGLELEKEYEKLFHMGNYERARTFYMYHEKGPYQVLFMFIDEPPYNRDGLTWYCVKEVGKGCMGDYHWYTLDQLMICD